MQQLGSLVKKFLNALNQWLPKEERAMVVAYPNTESSALSVANYIRSHYKIPVIYVVSKKAGDHPSGLLLPGIQQIQRHGNYWQSLHFHLKYMQSRYLFFTHGGVFDRFPKTQVATDQPTMPIGPMKN